VLSARRGADDVRAKAPGDLVTGSDLLVEAEIQRILRARRGG
jgi:hypothetical protein